MNPTGNRNAKNSLGAGIFLAVFGLPFFLAGLAVLFSPFWGPMHSDSGEPAPLLFIVPFGLIFAAIGGAFIYGGLVAIGILKPRYVAQQEAIEAAHPDKPWMWKPEWASGKIPAETKRGMIRAWLLAIAWNAISSPILFALPSELERGNTPILIGLIFPLVGIGIIVAAIRRTIVWKRYGAVYFEMAHVPVVPGGALSGVIHVPVEILPAGGFRIVLENIRRITRGSGKSRHVEEIVLWAREIIVARDLKPHDLTRTAIPVHIEIPPGAECTDSSDASNVIFWRLKATGDVPGVDFETDFEIPVFSGAAQVRTTSISAHEIDREGRGRDAVESEKIEAAIVSQGPSGETIVYFPRCRAPLMALGTLIILLMFTIIPGVVFHSVFTEPLEWNVTSFFDLISIPILLLIFLIDLALLHGLFDTLIGWVKISADRNEIRIRRGWFGPGSEKVIPVGQLAKFEVDGAGHVGKTRYYRIHFHPRTGKKVQGPEGIAGKTQADAIVRILSTATGIEDSPGAVAKRF